MSRQNRFVTAMFLSLSGLFTACTSVSPTVDNDPSLDYVELQGYKSHVRTYGDKSLPPVVVVHGGPGGDSKYLYPIQGLAQSQPVVFFDQRGTGLSPRVNKEALTLQSSLDDLHANLTHNSAAYQGKLLMISSECSFIGYAFQQEFHIPSLPSQTIHLQAKAMGHNMLTLNSAWSVAVLAEFFGGSL